MLTPTRKRVIVSAIILIALTVAAALLTANSDPERRSEKPSAGANQKATGVRLLTKLRIPEAKRTIDRSVLCGEDISKDSAACRVARNLNDLPPVTCASDDPKDPVAGPKTASTRVEGTIDGQNVNLVYTSGPCKEASDRWSEVEPLWGAQTTFNASVNVYPQPDITERRNISPPKNAAPLKKYPAPTAEQLLVKPCEITLPKDPYHACTIQSSDPTDKSFGIILRSADVKALKGASAEEVLAVIKSAERVKIDPQLTNTTTPTTKDRGPLTKGTTKQDDLKIKGDREFSKEMLERYESPSSKNDPVPPSPGLKYMMPNKLDDKD